MIRANEIGATATAATAAKVNVPLADLKAQYGQLKAEVLARAPTLV